MLSPASLRVCCLAVMAPALTKADRRADCLPVVLPFCVPKTATSENRKDKFNDISIVKLPNKIACLLSKRKHLMHKPWFRPYTRNYSELSDKNRYSPIDLRKSLLNNKIKVNAETKGKSWHGTSVTLAVADKVRLKYTMNKNNSSLRNMGLARANTSIGLHRMNRFAHLSHKDKRNPSNLTHESGGRSPDSTSSELETSFRIVRIVQPVQGQNTGEVSSGGISKCDSTLSPVENVTMSTAGNACSDIAMSGNPNIPLSSVSPDEVKVALNDSNLPVALTGSTCSQLEPESPNAGKVELSSQESNCNELLPPEPCDVPVKDVDSNDIAAIHEDPLASPLQSNQVVSEISDIKDSDLQVSTADCSNCITPLPSPLHNASEQGDVANVTAPLEVEASPFSVAPPGSPCLQLSPARSDCESGSFTSSTLSADASPLPSSLDEGNEKVFITFPDSFLASASGVHKELVAPAFSDASCFVFNNYDSVSSEDEMHIMRKTCCPLAAKDLSSFQDLLVEYEKKISIALDESQALLRTYLIDHVQKQIRTLVQHLQKKLTIPCQRQAKLSDLKPLRVDLKAELLQTKDVKNLSTAALVSLVRKLECNSSTGNLLLPQNVTSQDSEELKASLTPEDYADVKHTSKVLLSGMKRLLRSADPDLTESSDEGNSDIEVEESRESPAQKKALWKFMKERAALASRSTLLIAHIRELENQLRTVMGCLKKVSSSNEDICFEDQVASGSSTLSMVTSESSGDVSLKTSVKQSRPKGLGRPVNGYLDHSSVNSTIHVGATSSSEPLRLEQKLNNSSVTIDTSDSCSRTRALRTSNFHKRKLLVTTGLHLTNNKLAKLSTVGCVCNSQDEKLPCVLCTGRYNCIQSVDPDSLPLLDRVALLDPNFHPLLSFEKDIPLLVHFENILKKNEAQYQSVRPASPIPSDSNRRLRFGTKPKHLNDAKSRSRKLNRYARSLISAKYRNKKHFRKHKLVFGKWRKLQNKSSLHTRDRFRRYSVASSGSSHDSPVPSPLSAYDDGSGHDTRRRRDDNQFDIDDVIIPYSNKRGRLVKFEFKDIEIPSWRSIAFDNLKSIDMVEDTSDAAFVKRHEGYEIEERKIIRNGGGALCFFNTWQKRARRQHRSDSRADSSGANTPDPVLLCDQDIMFQDNSMPVNSPLSPALSPPTTPSSANLVSDDSQPPLGSTRKKVGGAKRQEELANARGSVADYDEIPPYERRAFPLSAETVEELLAESDHNRDDTDVTASGPSCPASPASTTSSTSTVEEEDATDPEWRVVRRESGPEQALVLKFAKR